MSFKFKICFLYLLCISNYITGQVLPYQFGFTKTNTDLLIGSPILLLDGAFANAPTWNDTSGLGNHATLLNTPIISSNQNGIVSFNGTSQYASLPSGFSNFSNGITLLAFVNFNGVSLWERILDFGNGQASDNIIFGRQDTTNNLWFEFRYGADQKLAVSITGGITNNAWGFYVARLDGLKYTMFNHMTSVTGSINFLPSMITRNNNYIGESNWDYDHFFDGDIGVVAVYDRPLTDAQIRTFYEYYRERYSLNPFYFFKNCNEILAAYPDSISGNYRIDYNGIETAGGEIDCYCDMTTDGGGWTLVLNYLHKGGTNPDLSVKTNSLPLQGSTSLGDDESGSSTNWGHAANSLLTEMAFTELRFYGKTSGHGRIIHFRTTHPNTLSYFKTGSGSMNGIENSYTPLTGHTAFLPASARDEYLNQGDEAMTNFPFWLGGTYHWGIRGLGSRWEVDDYPNNSTKDTFHQIWIR